MSYLHLASLFTLGFSSLFPLVNPIGTALILEPMFAGCARPQRKSAALTICFYSMGLGVFALFLGSWVLKFMGISIPTTQLAGGLLIARMGLSLLDAKSSGEDNGGPRPESLRDSLFYPITFPLTLGPGGISVMITLSAHAHGAEIAETLLNQCVLGFSLLAVMVISYFCFVYSELLIRRIGPRGSLVLNRLMAFLVFCIGLQVAVSGLERIFPHLFS